MQEEPTQSNPGVAGFEADVAYTARRLGLSTAQAFQLLGTAIASERATALITGVLEDRRVVCRELRVAFRTDCLSEGYRNVSGALARRGDYAEARRALDKTAAELEKLVKRRKSRSVASVNPQNGRPQSRAYQGIKPSGTDAAQKALQKAETSLLRSVPASDPRAAHYTEIAQVFGGDAVLLRS